MSPAAGTIALVFNSSRPEALATAARVAEWASRRGLRLLLSESESAALDSGEPRVGSGPGAPVMDEVPESTDAVVAVGGDGTVLRAVRMCAGRGIPIVGINVGYLGYLTRLEPDSAHGFLDLWLDGEEGRDWFYDDRAMVEATFPGPGGNPGTRFLALNEFVVEKQLPGQTVRLETTIDDAPFVTYVADGLIIATPTGSTAYSLSARGPVVSPRVNCLLLSPVSPHMAFDRSLVLDPGEVIQVKVVGQRPVSVASDGHLVSELEPGQVIQFKGAAEKSRFVRFEQLRFHQILRAKFAAGGL